MNRPRMHFEISRHLRTLAPAAALVLLCLLLRWVIEAPEQESVGLSLALLAALPWSLMVAVMDLSSGYGERAAWIIAIGVGLNLWLLWNVAGWLWDLRSHDSEDGG